jgi:hypothetical protein
VSVEARGGHWTIEHSRGGTTSLAGEQLASREDGTPIVLVPHDQYRSRVVTTADGTRLSIDVHGHDDPLAAALLLQDATAHSPAAAR